MLKGIPSIVSPELLKILMEMGHGDELLIADGNFPAASIAQRLVRRRPIMPRMDGQRAILLWLRGSYRSYTDYSQEVVALIGARAEF